MGPLGRRRQVVLFLVAMIAPCVALIVISGNVVRQERELGQRRREAEKARALDQVRDELLIRLERIRLDPQAHSAVALVARVENGAMVLPWDPNPAAERFREETAGGEYGRLVRQAEQLEVAGAELGRSAMLARQAMQAARGGLQSAYARLLYGRVLLKLERKAEAFQELRALLGTPREIVDENGVPVGLYAAEALLGAGVEREASAKAVLAAAEAPGMPSPVACELLARLLKPLGPVLLEKGDAAGQRVAGQIALMQEGEALRSDFSRLRLRADHWVLYGDEPWLVSAGPIGGAEAVVAVRAGAILPAVRDAWNARRWATVDFVTDGPGELLGDAFPGLKATMELSDAAELLRRETWRRQLAYLALLPLIAATTFSAWLLWRDLRREVEVAAVRTQFVSSVSHELKTPLTAIRMFAETLQLRQAWDEAKRSEYAATIVSECERLSRLVEDILAFSKMQQGKKTYRMRPTGLDYVVRSAVRAVDYAMAQQGFELRVKMAGDLPRIRADSDALEQALLNLISNAMKYSGESRTIELEAERRNGEAVIRVRDHGVGMAPEHQARIFEQYYRAPTRENELITGAGLGLALVAHIVKAHGGRIEVESAPGRGSTFSMHLPLEEI